MQVILGLQFWRKMKSNAKFFAWTSGYRDTLKYLSDILRSPWQNCNWSGYLLKLESPRPQNTFFQMSKKYKVMWHVEKKLKLPCGNQTCLVGKSTIPEDFPDDFPTVFPGSFNILARLHHLKDAMQQATQARLRRAFPLAVTTADQEEQLCWIVIWYGKVQNLVRRWGAEQSSHQTATIQQKVSWIWGRTSYPLVSSVLWRLPIAWGILQSSASGYLDRISQGQLIQAA